MRTIIRFHVAARPSGEEIYEGGGNSGQEEVGR